MIQNTKDSSPRLIALSFAVLSACGPVQKSPDPYSLDGVKLISPSITGQLDGSSYGQKSYTLSDSSRLLLRYEKLGQNSDRILVDAQNKVEIQVTASSSSDADAAKDSLKLCPLSRNWMMLATWEYAHPFMNKAGRWQNAGGDYETDGPDGCQKASRTSGQDLFFDVSHWFEDFPRGRGVNYGFVLLSDKSVSVYGDSSGSFSPRIIYKESGTTISFGN